MINRDEHFAALTTRYGIMISWASIGVWGGGGGGEGGGGVGRGGYTAGGGQHRNCPPPPLFLLLHYRYFWLKTCLALYHFHCNITLWTWSLTKHCYAYHSIMSLEKLGVRRRLSHPQGVRGGGGGGGWGRGAGGKARELWSIAINGGETKCDVHSHRRASNVNLFESVVNFYLGENDMSCFFN